MADAGLAPQRSQARSGSLAAAGPGPAAGGRVCRDPGEPGQFRWIKVAGGLYLLYLGLSSFLKARKAAREGPAAEGRQQPLRYSCPAACGSGLLSTLLNPKVGLFYLAVVLQFIPHGGNTLGMAMVLGLTLTTIGFLYLAVIAVVAFKAMQWLRRPKVNTIIERISSGILAVLGVGVMASGASS